jgi:hypothetical protein
MKALWVRVVLMIAIVTPDQAIGRIKFSYARSGVFPV